MLCQFELIMVSSFWEELEVNMNKSLLGKILYMAACVITIATLFIPCQKIEIVQGVGAGEKTVQYVKLMPSIMGFVILFLGVAGIFVANSPKRRLSALLGTFSGLSLVGLLLKFTFSAGVETSNASMYKEAMAALGGYNPNDYTFTTTITNYYGYYFMAFAAIFVIIAGFICLLTYDGEYDD